LGRQAASIFKLEMEGKVANSFERVIANFEFALCRKQEANDMKLHRYANLRIAQFVLFCALLITDIKTQTQQNT